MSEPLSLNVQARSVGNAVYLEHIGGCGDIAAWGEINFSTAEFVAEQINALLARFRAVIDMPAKMVFADGREPTTNERHLWNLLTWREADLAKQKEQTEYFKQQCDEAGTEIDRLKQQIEGHCERIVAASEVIARNAERSVWTRLEASHSSPGSAWKPRCASTIHRPTPSKSTRQPGTCTVACSSRTSTARRSDCA